MKDRYVTINDVRFDLKTFHSLHKNFNIGNAISVVYDRQKTVFNDGINQWGGPVPWKDGELVLLRFRDLLMMKKHLSSKEEV